jgi:hypothetical protein
MELIQSFIAIPEAAVKQQVQQQNLASSVEAHQPTQSQELATVEVLLFKKPFFAGRTVAQNDVARVKAI